MSSDISPLVEKAEYIHNVYLQPSVTLLSKILPKKEGESKIAYSIRASQCTLTLLDVYSTMNRVYEHGSSYICHMTRVMADDTLRPYVDNTGFLQLLSAFILVIPYEALKVYLSRQNDGNFPATLNECFSVLTDTHPTVQQWNAMIRPYLDSKNLKEQL